MSSLGGVPYVPLDGAKGTAGTGYLGQRVIEQFIESNFDTSSLDGTNGFVVSNSDTSNNTVSKISFPVAYFEGVLSMF